MYTVSVYRRSDNALVAISDPIWDIYAAMKWGEQHANEDEYYTIGEE